MNENTTFKIVAASNPDWRRPKSLGRKSLLFGLLWVGIALPPLYLFVMVQYGAITFPFWDHLATAKLIIDYFNGTLAFGSLFDLTNHARILFPRLLLISNAALTDWDVRSEYVYTYLTVFGALAALLLALRRISTTWPTTTTLTTALLISVIACSPQGAHNYYWSLMVVATLPYFCAIGALLAVSLDPFSWRANIFAAALAWIASYSIVHGLLVFPTIILLHQIIAPFRLTRMTVFWLINIVVCYVPYFQGPPLEGDEVGAFPAIFNFVSFIVLYIGNPLGSLLWFPYHGAIDLPHTTVINAICGVILIAVSSYTTWHALKKPLSGSSLIFLSFAMFSVACALITARGRARGEEPILGANSSRYSIFGAMLLFGLIFYYAPRLTGRWTKLAVGLFLVLCTVSYYNGATVYRMARDRNVWLRADYAPHAAASEFDERMYPEGHEGYFSSLKVEMFRIGIGPYRFSEETVLPLTGADFMVAVPLVAGSVVKQSFPVAQPEVRSISFKVATWARFQWPYNIHWRLTGSKNRTVFGEGSFSAFAKEDWGVVMIRPQRSVDDTEAELTFWVDPKAKIINPLSLAIYRGLDPSEPAVIDGVTRSDGGKVGLSVAYAK